MRNVSHLSTFVRSRHTLLMIVGCLAPLSIALAVAVFSVPLSTVALFAVLLLCPLTHLFLMRGMGHDDRCVGSKQVDNPSSAKEENDQREGSTTRT